MTVMRSMLHSARDQQMKPIQRKIISCLSCIEALHLLRTCGSSSKIGHYGKYCQSYIKINSDTRSNHVLFTIWWNQGIIASDRPVENITERIFLLKHQRLCIYSLLSGGGYQLHEQGISDVFDNYSPQLTVLYCSKVIAVLFA